MAQGVAIARMQWADRDRPGGQRRVVARTASGSPTRAGAFLLPGLPGAERRRLEWVYPAATPLIAPALAWHDADDKVDAFWGPSVHWNTAIEQYVMLLNRAKDENYTQEGIYVSYAPRLDDPSLWTRAAEDIERRPLVPAGGRFVHWHRDRQARGRSPRFFMSGKSEWVINFTK